MSEYPKIIKAINPKLDPKTDELKYSNLPPSARNEAKKIKIRNLEYISTYHGTLAEEDAANKLAVSYLIQIANRAVNSINTSQEQKWCDRYTEASIEIYGEPDKNLSLGFLEAYMYDLENSNVDEELKDRIKLHVKSLGISYSVNKSNKYLDDISELNSMTGNFLKEKYKDIFSIFDSLDQELLLTPIKVESIFSHCLRLLKVEDLRWLEWKVQIQNDSSNMSVKASEKTINIGEFREALKPLEAKSLFVHEVLGHGLRSVNGQSISKELSLGLPGYLNAEEGYCSWLEGSVIGQIPSKLIDRYLDISIALGQLGSIKVPRKDLLKFGLLREEFRAQKSNQKFYLNESEKKIIAHTNRIYRGTKGGEIVGVFTKDVVYLKGYLLIANYISSNLKKFQNIGKIIEYLAIGKYDPTNKKHIAYIGKTAKDVINEKL